MNERNIVLEYADADGKVNEVRFNSEYSAHLWAANWDIGAYVVHVPFLAPVEGVYSE